MAASDFTAVLMAHEQSARLASSRIGQRPTDKPDRDSLGMSLEIAAAQSMLHMTSTHHPRTTMIPYAYPPSTAPLTELVPVNLSDLRLETHHRGKVIFVRTFTDPAGMVAILTAVEDAQGNVDRMSLYNISRAMTPSQALPKNAILAIKEPFYKAMAEGCYTIRVDHPCDIVRLMPDHPCIPTELKSFQACLRSSALSYKTRGNTAYKSKDFVAAVEHYTLGLQACEDTLLKHDMLRNRAIANHRLKRYEYAVQDAQASLLSQTDLPDSQRAHLNSKALFRAGCAQYALCSYRQAASFLDEAQKILPDNHDVLREKSRTSQRLLELASDDFDPSILLKSLRKNNLRLDHASFLKNTEVRDAGKRGRGLFATRDIPCGSLIFAEKAFDVAFAADDTTETFAVINLNTKRTRIGLHASLMWSILERIQHNREEARAVLQLYDGGYLAKCEGRQIDGVTVVDSFQVQAILEYNGFSCPNLRSGDGSGKLQNTQSSTGLWITASYANHACVANAIHSFMGDFMLTYASRHIARGEEITVSYRDCVEDYTKCIKDLRETWGFECDCDICCIEQDIPAALRSTRRSLLAKAESLASMHEQTPLQRASQDARQKMKQLYHQITQTFPSAKYEGRPRVELITTSMWLCNACTTSDTAEKHVETALEVLRNLGFIVKIREDSVSINREHALVRYVATDAASSAAQGFKFLGRANVSKAFEDFAKSNYRIMQGDLYAYDDYYRLP